MTTRWRQKASSILAIVGVIVLLLLIIFLWTAVKNGVFSSHSTSVYNKINITGSSEINPHSTQKLTNNDKISSNSTYLTREDNEPPPSTPTTKTNMLPSSLDDLPIDEFVKPSKIHIKPLHADDLLYESKKGVPGADTLGKLPDHRITGQFRSKSSRIWDPHPEYLIDAFGFHLHLILKQDGSFIPKDMKVTHLIHVNENETLRTHEDGKDTEKLQGCFYKGRVRGDERSSVTVSLCDGMKGHIYTSSGSFFIQPVEEYTIENPNILHKITREQILRKQTPNEDTSVESQCGICQDKDCIHLNDDIVHADEVLNVHSRRKRSIPSSINNAYTIEVLVAVDKKMEEYHRENANDLRQYILTLMSIVSSVYADASIGNSVKIAVVEILHLKNHSITPDHTNSNAGVSASQMLSKFCKYIQQNSRRQHDTALLLTREQICRNGNQMKCDTLGLAELGTMCRPSSCAIVQDNGLSAAFTIAHELGHVLSMPHDDDVKCRNHNKGDPPNIMSRMLDHNTHPWSWSECSRYYVTEYLENNYGSCMLDTPRNDLIKKYYNEDELAGEKFTAAKQCKLVFGSDSTVCSYMPKCSRLWCGNDSEGCRTQHMPWADGTPCGEGDYTEHFWCQRGECVPRNRESLVKRNGNWGPWSSYSECSRTCGGGVRSKVRECNSPAPENGGIYCIGQRIEYDSCNIASCPWEALDFREQQCAEFNNQSFGITGIADNVTWNPKYGAPPLEECKLFCRAENSNNYFQLRDKVIDGTSCTHDSFNKCVNGVCRPAGCDNILFSTAILDKCGKCNGNNETCIDVNESFSREDLSAAKRLSTNTFYFFVCTIPKGALNIEIIQRGSLDDLNYIALIDDNNSYILNGHNVITQYPRTFAYGGVTFEYTGTNSTMEKVNTSYARKLTRELRVQILSRTDQYLYGELMSYSYNIGKETRSFSWPQEHSAQLKWRISEWSKCDKICNGTRTRTAECIQHDTHVVPDSYCTSQKPQNQIEYCNTHCKYFWQTTNCSTDCHERTYVPSAKCVKESRDVVAIIEAVESIYCAEMPKPIVCEGPCWLYGAWENCSQACNGGIQKRKSYCLSGKQPSDVSYCKSIAADELVERPCNTISCPKWTFIDDTPVYGAAILMEYADDIPPTTINNNVYDDHPRPSQLQRYKWRTSRWGECSVTCGDKGVRVRSVRCAAENMELVDDRYCAENIRPTNATTCGEQRCPEWKASDWGECKSDCKRERRLICHNGTGEIDDSYCLALTETKPRQTEACCSYKWRNGWTPCSTTCGPGIRTRQRVCMRLPPKIANDPSPRKRGEPVHSSFCYHIKPPPFRPKEKACKKPCYTHKWEVSAWSRCSNGCGQGFANRNVFCMLGKRIVNDTECKSMQKPIKSRHCESKKDCHWKYEPWKNCSCGGYTKRIVKCYDNHGKLSNSCSEQAKPPEKKKCLPPSNCSCKTLQLRERKRQNAEYDLNVRGRKIRIYCHDMNTANPKEYITLVAGYSENYALYYDKRSKDRNQCPRSERDEYKDESIPAGLTYFEKIRINLHTLTVIEDDFQFVRTSGNRNQPFGSAGDCYSTTTGQCPQGHFSINFAGTKFRIRPGTRWDNRNSTIIYTHKLEPPYKKVAARCGGFCGSCFVSKVTSLQLQIE